jgi:hypothetical protein
MTKKFILFFGSICYGIAYYTFLLHRKLKQMKHILFREKPTSVYN